VVSLPFEQVPSLSIGGGTIRFSQLLTLLSAFLMMILIAKGEQKITQRKINYFLYASIAFFAASIPSWFFILDANRFYITLIPTALVFVAAILLSHFLDRPIRALQYLYLSLFLTTIFGAYQFAGDMIGIPKELTFLSERYTKIIFGFPRIHSTAIEPLYYAGMLFLPVIAFFVYWLAHPKDLLPAIFTKVPLASLLVSVFFGFFLAITLSKSAIGIIGLIIALILLLWMVKYPTLSTAKDLVSIGLISIIGLYGITTFFPFSNQYFEIILTHILDTFTGDSTSITERQIFLNVADQLLPYHYLIGVGNGQFGVYASHMLRFLKLIGDGYFIVNNVYIEILVENGLTTLLVFITSLFGTIFLSFKKLLQIDDWKQHNVLHIVILLFTLIAYSIQWLTFSPVYIMPIFIIWGLLINLLTRQTLATKRAKD
jgi:O-antigen ligase